MPKVEIPRKEYTFGKGQWTSNCQICDIDDHEMLSRTTYCSRHGCSPDCDFTVKVLTCSNSDQEILYVGGVHTLKVSSEPEKKVRTKHSPLLVSFVTERIHRFPKSIMKEWKKDFSKEVCPDLNSFQNLVCRLRAKEFSNAEAKILEYLDTLKFTTDPSLVFSFRADIKNRKLVDDNNLVIGFTSKNCLQNVERCHAGGRDAMLHIDATYCLNNCRLPVVVVGVSDAMGHLHPLAVFLVKNETADTYNVLLKLLKEEIRSSLTIQFQPKYVMTDAAKSFLKAVKDSFPDALHLTCFFHVKQACRKKAKKDWKVIDGLIDCLHFTQEEEDYSLAYEDVMSTMQGINPRFAAYFERIWGAESDNKKWQIFNAPPAFCTTNNPVEQLNKSLKALHVKRKSPLVICMQGLVSFLSEEQAEFRSTRIRSEDLEKKWEAHFPDLSIIQEADGYYQIEHKPSSKVAWASDSFCDCAYKRKWSHCIHTFYVAVKKKNLIPAYRRSFSAPSKLKGRPKFHEKAPIIFI